MAQLQKGTTYITGDQVTAANLNALVDSGILTPGAVTDQTAKTVPLAADTILLHSAADTALRKTTMTQLFATPQPLGATTPSSVAATTGTFSSTLGVTGVATLGNGAILGTPASGTVTNLTGTASININGTVGATTAAAGSFTTVAATASGTPAAFTKNSDGIIQTLTRASVSEWRFNIANSDPFGGQAGSLAIYPGNASVDFIIGRSNGTTANLKITDANGNAAFAGTISATGAAITGTLSATGTITANASGGRSNVFVGDSVAGTYSVLRMLNGSANKAWEIDNGNFTLGTLSFTPSTTAGGTTFSNPVVAISSTGLAVTGTLSCTTGAAVGGATAGAGGLAFPATAVAVADANTLDDYEEGTWTPTDDSGAGLSLTVYSATYTKIGRLVEIEATIQLPSTASTANMKFAGLPFTAAGGDDNTGGLCITATSAGRDDYFLITRATTTFTPTSNTNANIQNVSYSTKKVNFFGYYHV